MFDQYSPQYPVHKCSINRYLTGIYSIFCGNMQVCVDFCRISGFCATSEFLSVQADVLLRKIYDHYLSSVLFGLGFHNNP